MAYRKTPPLSEAQIKKMHERYLSGLTLSQVGEPYGVSQQALSTIFHRRNLAVRKRGETRSRITIADEVDDSSLLQFKLSWDGLDSTVKGTVSENYVKNKLAELGFDVWEPVTQNHRTDLIVLSGKGLLRIQVKTATYDRDRKRFRALLSRRGRSRKREIYQEEDVDFFIVYCAGLQELEFYVIPANLVCKQPCINLLPHRRRYSSRYPSNGSWEAYRNAFHLLSA